MEPQPVVVPPGEGHRVGNVEFLARSVDTPRFTFGIIEIAPARELEAHVHSDEDDAFYIVEREMTFVFVDERVNAPPGTFVGERHGEAGVVVRRDQDLTRPRAGPSDRRMRSRRRTQLRCSRGWRS